MKMKLQGLTLATMAMTCLLGVQSAQAGVVSLVNTFNNVTDYSPGGLNLGQEGFIFFNWNNANAANAGAFQNLNNQLPSWMTFKQTQGNPDSGIGDLAYSQGGLVNLTLPDGLNAASGSLNDPEANGNSNNTIRQFEMLAGHPSRYLLSVVVDNTAGLHNPDDRLRARLNNGGGFNASPGAGGFDGSPDVYQFLMDPNATNDFLKIQLRSLAGVGGGTGSGNDPGIAGFMIDLIPEPTSAVLLVIGSIGLIGRRRRR